MRITLLISFGLFHLTLSQNLLFGVPELGSGKFDDDEDLGSGRIIDSRPTTVNPLPIKPGEKTTIKASNIILNVDDEDFADNEYSGTDPTTQPKTSTLPIVKPKPTVTTFVKLDQEDGDDDCEGSVLVGSGCEPKFGVARHEVPMVTETEPPVIVSRIETTPPTPPPTAPPILEISTLFASDPSTDAPTTVRPSTAKPTTPSEPATVLPLRTTKKDEDPIFIETDKLEGNTVVKSERTTVPTTKKTEVPGQGGKDGFNGDDGIDKEDVVPPLIGHPGILAAVIGGGVVGLLCAILLVMFIVYRIRKKDEGSYPLDDKPARLHTYTKAPSKEFYA